jgi:hypothetical protein
MFILAMTVELDEQNDGLRVTIKEVSWSKILG